MRNGRLPTGLIHCTGITSGLKLYSVVWSCNRRDFLLGKGGMGFVHFGLHFLHMYVHIMYVDRLVDGLTLMWHGC